MPYFVCIFYTLLLVDVYAAAACDVMVILNVRVVYLVTLGTPQPGVPGSLRNVSA